MSSKIEVSREAIEFTAECLERCQDQAFQACECESCPQCGKMPDECTGTDCSKTCQCSTCEHCVNEEAINGLRALLAAPVVERQPVAWDSWSVGDTVRYLGSGEDSSDCYCRMTIDSDYLIHEVPDESEMMLVLDDDGDELGVLVGEFEFIARDGYSRTAPTELAELQATITRLKAENERNAKNAKEWEEASLHWMTERDQFKAEIERLKGGQGEPVAEVVSKFGDPEAFGEREVIALKDLSRLPYGTKLYAEQPAPVAFPGYPPVPGCAEGSE